MVLESFLLKLKNYLVQMLFFFFFFSQKFLKGFNKLVILFDELQTFPSRYSSSTEIPVSIDDANDILPLSLFLAANKLLDPQIFLCFAGTLTEFQNLRVYSPLKEDRNFRETLPLEFFEDTKIMKVETTVFFFFKKKKVFEALFEFDHEFQLELQSICSKLVGPPRVLETFLFCLIDSKNKFNLHEILEKSMRSYHFELMNRVSAIPLQTLLSLFLFYDFYGGKIVKQPSTTVYLFPNQSKGFNELNQKFDFSGRILSQIVADSGLTRIIYDNNGYTLYPFYPFAMQHLTRHFQLENEQVFFKFFFLKKLTFFFFFFFLQIIIHAFLKIQTIQEKFEFLIRHELCTNSPLYKKIFNNSLTFQPSTNLRGNQYKIIQSIPEEFNQIFIFQNSNSNLPDLIIPFVDTKPWGVYPMFIKFDKGTMDLHSVASTLYQAVKNYKVDRYIIVLISRTNKNYSVPSSFENFIFLGPDDFKNLNYSFSFFTQDKLNLLDSIDYLLALGISPESLAPYLAQSIVFFFLKKKF